MHRYGRILFRRGLESAKAFRPRDVVSNQRPNKYSPGRQIRIMIISEVFIDIHIAILKTKPFCNILVLFGIL